MEKKGIDKRKRYARRKIIKTTEGFNEENFISVITRDVIVNEIKYSLMDVFN